MDKYNAISSIECEGNKEYLFWKTGSNNNHNQDFEICYDDHYCVHSEPVGCNPSKIPNNGERIVLLSSVSRGVILSSMSAVKNEKVKNKEVKNHHGNNYDDSYIDTTSATELECLEWYVKRYRVNNDTSIHYSPSGLSKNVEDTKVEWFLK